MELFALNDDERVITETAAAFAAKRLAPYALEWEAAHHFPTDVLREAAELGMAAIYCRDDVGGSGLRRLDGVRIFEQLGVWERVAADAQPIHGMKITDSGTGDIARPLFLKFEGDVAPGEPFAHMVPNPALVAAVLAGLGDAAEFRWQVDFSTHGGLPGQACGAWPARAEERDFLERLKGRDTYPFLSELFDAQVMTADGKPAPRTLAEMARADDGIIPVALHKRNGVTYLVLISREKTDKKGPLLDGVTIDVAFHGKVEMVDEMTGQPLPQAVDAVETPGGVRLRNVQAARIPGAIGERSDTPFKLPIYRITP